MAIVLMDNRLFVLHTQNTTYAMGVDERGVLRHLYYGAKIDRAADFMHALTHPIELWENGSDQVMEEFSSFGCLRNKETSLKIAYADRTRDFRYRLTNCETAGDELILTLRDEEYAFVVRLHYRVDEHHDIIRRWVELQNDGDAPVRVDRIFSAEIALAGEGYQVLNVSGVWAMEQQLHADPITAGKKVYESMAGCTGFSNQPWFAAYRQADERAGDVTFGCLAYTGNFKVIAECVPYHYLNVTLGISDTDFAMPLAPGAAFVTPEVYLGFTREGLDGMSRMMHAFEHDELMPVARRDVPQPVLYNSWYATEFDVFGEEQERLADKAAEIGVEMFVIDDGWFGQRHSDRAGLGDWYVNPEKFPQGLGHLIDHVHSLGMQFGLWIEPEMVNPDSDLYRAHPDWVYRYGKRPIIMGRNQYALNLTKPEVVDYLIATFDALLSSYAIDYIKWDMNRFMAEALDDAGNDGMVWYNHSRGFMRLARALRQRHPNMSFEACAGGGARVNAETLSLFDQFWPSDNTNPLDRCRIQEGYTMMYPAKYMRAWITDDSRLSTSFRARCAMCGALGIGSNLNRLSEKELAELKEEIALYKRIRDTVQFGRLYRLRRLETNSAQIWQYVRGGQCVVITLVDHAAERLAPVCLQGLEPQALYQVGEGERAYVVSGAYLMNCGLITAGNRDRSGTVLILNRVEGA